MSKTFYDKWDKVYRLFKQKKKKFHVTAETKFGDIEQFDKKKVGPYHVIKNFSYAEKKGSAWINKTREQSFIQLKFDPTQFHFSQMPYFEIISFVDLDEEKLVPPIQREDSQIIQENEFLTDHIIKISNSQIAHGHSIYVPYLQQHLPQILTPRLIQSIIKLSGILPGQKIGYNSQGGGSTVNHFHAQILNGHSLLNDNTFHFEEIKGRLITTLIVDVDDSRETAKVEVSSFEYVGALYIRIRSKQHTIFEKSIISGIVRAVWTIIEIALANNIPHNLNIPNDHEVYIILRSFATNDIKFGWVQFSGVQIITNGPDFDNVTEELIRERYSKVTLPREIIEGKFSKRI